MNHVANTKIRPLLKWPGGKSGELDVILPNIPSSFSRYFEPFAGGAAVYLALNDKAASFINDKSADLITFYKSVANQDPIFFDTLSFMTVAWDTISNIIDAHEDETLALYQVSDDEIAEALDIYLDLVSKELNPILSSPKIFNAANFMSEVRKRVPVKIKRTKKVEQKNGTLPRSDILDNVEGAFKAAFYMHVRSLFNHPGKYGVLQPSHAAVFFFMREYCYASMFRFNKKGEFNIPYGGISYNRKRLNSKIGRLTETRLIEKLGNTTIEALDFHDFVKIHKPEEGDFIFLDPPYDSDFSEYDKNVFDQSDHGRLQNFLLSTSAQWMLVIKSTDYIMDLYKPHGVNIQAYDMTYMWNVRERNDRDVTHLMITNY